MKAVEYTAQVLAGGHLEIPATAWRELQLHPNAPVKVILMCEEERAEDNERRAAARAQVWRQVDALRERLSGKDFSLTDSLLQAREEEDASL